MKNTLLLFLLLLRLFSVSAQDQLFKSDNSKLLVKVLEVGTEDIKYKLFDDPGGPVYIVSKENVSLIIYQNGEHQVIKPAEKQKTSERLPTLDESSRFYNYENCVSLNFLNLINSEVGVTYRREFYNRHYSLIFPFAVGFNDPTITQNVYYNTSPVHVELNRKIFEVGFGANYYPTLKNSTNYYIGPVLRYMQYDVTQEALSWPNYMIASNNTVLSRYAVSITNGIIIRSKSRLTTNMFISLGFKSDKVTDPLYDPGGQLIITIPNPTSLYWWSGFEVGFSF